MCSRVTWVKPGQLLLRLEDADARLQAARAEAQLKGADADINAVQNGGTQEEVLNTRNALVKAQADRDVAERNYQAMQRLLQTGAASQAEVDAAQGPAAGRRFRCAPAAAKVEGPLFAGANGTCRGATDGGASLVAGRAGAAEELQHHRSPGGHGVFAAGARMAPS